MTAICGIFQRSQPGESTGAIESMLLSMSHRGDYQNRVSAPGVLFAELLDKGSVAVSRESSLKQLRFVSDARIDNRNELASKLGLDRSDLAQTSNSELIKRAYAKWGEQCADYLVGDFVFAGWDERSKQMILARDPMGVRPLYYFMDKDLVAFATEVRALYHVVGSKLSINHYRIVDYWHGYETIDLSSTFFNEIHRLPAGHCLLLTADAQNIVDYWNPAIGDRGVFDSQENALEEFGELFDTAIDSRLSDSGRTGVLFSGGPDSTAVVSAMQSRRIETQLYSAVQDSSVCADSAAINDYLSRHNVLSNRLHIDEFDYLSPKLKRLVDQLDDPFAPTLMLASLLYQSALAEQDEVVLDGVDGDLGYSLPVSLPAFLWREGQHFSAVMEDRYIAGPKLLPWLRSVMSYARPRLLNRSLNDRKLVEDDIREGLLASETLDWLKTDERLVQRYADYHFGGQFSSVAVLHLSRVKRPHISVAMERYDRVSSSVGLDVRHPLLDRRLIEFSLRLPWSMKFSRGFSKPVIREYLESQGEQAIAWRKDKPHVGPAFIKNWISYNWQEIREVSLDHRELWQPYFCEQEILNRFPAVAYDDRLGSDPWDIYILVCWLRQFGNPAVETHP